MTTDVPWPTALSTFICPPTTASMVLWNNNPLPVPSLSMRLDAATPTPSSWITTRKPPDQIASIARRRGRAPSPPRP